MRTLSVLLVLMSCFSKGFSQYFNPDDFNEHIQQRFDVSVYNPADLFDSCEIQGRKIKSAALLLVYEGTSATDTLFVYYFDSTGQVVSQVTFTRPSLDAEGDSYVRDRVCDVNNSGIVPGEKDRYVTINRTPYGIERRLFSRTNDEMLDSEFIISRSCGEAFIQTNGRSEMIAYPIEQGSLLTGKIVSIQMDEGYYTTQYLIKYSDK